MKKAALYFAVALVPFDFLMLFTAGISAYFLRVSDLVVQYRPVLFYFNLPFSRFVFLLLSAIPIWMIIFALTGLYSTKRKDALEEFFQIIASSSFALMIMIVYIFMRSELFDSRFIIVATGLFAIVYVFTGRLLLRALERYAKMKYQWGLERILLVGDNRAFDELAQHAHNNPALGYKVVKRIVSPDVEEIKKAMENSAIDTVMVGQADSDKDALAECAEFCRDAHLRFLFAPTLFQALTTHVGMEIIGGIPFVEVRHTALDGWGNVLKRVMDIAGSLFGLIILSPLFAIIAIAIKLDSEGPVFVELSRVSFGKTFKLYKFRSMINNAHQLKPQLLTRNERKDGGPLFKMHNDPRVTPVGRFLRRTRLDEFPQLFNVARGDMSLVGPRPHEPEEVARYETHHKKLLVIKAGITGMAQISGSSDLPFEEEVKLDTYYIENWSLSLDCSILLRTAFTFFRDRSAC